jgi:gamma-glutamylcyclotransferase (GGCT)/AIG2-like uncharacterized protein YtfP
MDRVFVYGTLRPGQKYHYLIEKHVVKAVPAFAEGKLYHLLEGYPALLLEKRAAQAENGMRIRGDLLEISDLGKVLPILDELEDYYGPGDPRNLYERITLPVFTGDGTAMSGIAYVFPSEKAEWLERNAIAIPSGDWIQR